MRFSGISHRSFEELTRIKAVIYLFFPASSTFFKDKIRITYIWLKKQFLNWSRPRGRHFQLKKYCIYLHWRFFSMYLQYFKTRLGSSLAYFWNSSTHIIDTYTFYSVDIAESCCSTRIISLLIMIYLIKLWPRQPIQYTEPCIMANL